MADQTSTILAHSRRSCGLCCTRLTDFGVVLGNIAVIEKINLHVHCGELTVIIGPNGAGKTSLLKAILGELPHTGRLQFVRSDRKEARGRPQIGYVPQRFDLDAQAPVSVMDLFSTTLSRWPVWLGHRRRVTETALTMLAHVQSAHLANRRLGELSTGQLQRVLLALALTPAPDILLLDEPTSGMDPAGAALFYEIISKLRHDYDLSIILVSHELPVVARFADRMLLLNRAVLCDGPPREVLNNKLIAETLGYNPAVSAPPADDKFTMRQRLRQECENRSATDLPVIQIGRERRAIHPLRRTSL